MFDRQNLVMLKVGTDVVSRPNGTFRRAFMESFARQTSTLIHQGRHVVLTTSGAVGKGRPLLRKVGWVPDAEHKLVDKAWASSVGQARLFRRWEELFIRQGVLACGQVLIHNDFFTNGMNEPRKNWLALVKRANSFPGTILILNQNDPLTNQENAPCSSENPDAIPDNDGTNCVVGLALGAPLSITVSSFALHSEDPRRNKSANLIPFVNFADDKLNPVALGVNTEGVSCTGTGGWDIKLDRNRQFVQGGPCGKQTGYVISPQDVMNGGLLRAVAGEAIGTKIVCRRPKGVSIADCPGKRFGCTK